MASDCEDYLTARFTSHPSEKLVHFKTAGSFVVNGENGVAYLNPRISRWTMVKHLDNGSVITLTGNHATCHPKIFPVFLCGHRRSQEE